MTFSRFIAVLVLSSSLLAQAPSKDDVVAGSERAFDRASKAVAMPAPGCAVGVSLNGEAVFQKAFGLAEMEHNIANTPLTIFESGSVAKQFTAASIVLLSIEGKLSIDDPVRKYIPELPDYGAPLTIRHLLNHTAGLRDWGSVMGLTGVGRGDRVITQDLAMQVIVDQRALDFRPGDEYSYSNSGYTLLTTIVERVSKQSLPQFTAERFFKPLSMTHSSWRDDYQRIVPGRAQAYFRTGKDQWRLEMPFMNVYGNGGMLTTIGDWVIWNHMLETRSMGTKLVDELEKTGVLNDGRKIAYALGLTVNKYSGQTEISHNGSTAGYQTYLGRFPDKKLTVAILCNGNTPNSTNLGHEIIDEIFGKPPMPALPKVAVSPQELQKYAAFWRNVRTHLTNRTIVENGELKLAGQGPLIPLGDGTFNGSGAKYTFKTDASGKAVSLNILAGDTVLDYVAEQDWTPTNDDLSHFVGDWYSSEAEARFSIRLEGNKLFFTQRPSTKEALKPEYKDGFTFAANRGTALWATRDRSGKIDKLHIGLNRLRDMPFVRAAK